MTYWTFYQLAWKRCEWATEAIVKLFLLVFCKWQMQGNKIRITNIKVNIIRAIRVIQSGL